MTEIIKHINDTNASYRSLGAGNAKNTDLFLDAEHYEMFQGEGEQITVRFRRENLTKAMLFIASILPRKYDNSSVHENIPFSTEFVYTQLAILNGFFSEKGNQLETRTQKWNLRKDIVKKNGEVDNRFYFNGLIEDITYSNHKNETVSAKFTIRNYLAGGYSDLHIKKADDGIFDVWITNTTEPYNDNKDNNISHYLSTEHKSTNTKSYLPYLTALRTKPFMLLAGISGTGKSRIVRKLAQATNTKEYANEEDRWKDNRPDNFQLIQVKPNWHNSMDVVGFLSNIPEPHYVFTDFVRFIVKAWQHPETPYFLCLDEMNLAPVEEYFAEFLSAIESRAWDEEGNYTTDPIISPFKDFGKKVCEAMLKELLGEAHHTEANPLAIQFENKGLTLPPNLMVMGTVNMDETTFSFSRKVLDRAMSVEMNEVNYDDFKEGKTELMPLLTDYNDLLVNRPQKAQEVQGEIDSQKVIDYLKAVNELLDSTPFKLGYRAANEAILYVAASQEFAQGTFSLGKALDEFTLMKILSRIEGDDSRLAIDENDERLQKAGLSESPLDNGEQSLTLLNGLRAIVRQHIGAETETEKKINHMYTTLCREHFVSYWA